MFTCTVFQNTFFFLRFIQAIFFFFLLVLLTYTPNLCTFAQIFSFCRFIASSADVTSLTTWSLGQSVSWLWSARCCGGFQHFKKKKVILSKRELHNFSKWTSKDLLRIKKTLINCFRILLWPKWRLVGCRYIYYTKCSESFNIPAVLSGKTPCP